VIHGDGLDEVTDQALESVEAAVGRRRLEDQVAAKFGDYRWLTPKLTFDLTDPFDPTVPAPARTDERR
jgi:hypothetical protein